MTRAPRVLGAGLLLVLSCVGARQACAEGCPPQRTAVHSVDEAEHLAIEAARARHLSSLAFNCVATQATLDTDEAGKPGYIVTFRESHKPECGGDPMTGPRMFTILVTPEGRMRTDANPIDMANGRFRRLTCPARAVASARPAASAASAASAAVAHEQPAQTRQP